MSEGPRYLAARLLGVACLLATAACGQALATRTPGVEINKSRLAGMPPTVELSEFGMDNTVVLRPDWTTTAVANLENSLGRRLSFHGAASVKPEVLAGTKPTYAFFSEWSRETLMEISQQLDGNAEVQRRSVSEWQLKGDLSPWRTALNSDFLLLWLLRQTQVSTGVAISNLITPVKHSGRSLAIACIMDLRDGRIVWCERQVNFPGDLRISSGAEHTMNNLLKSLLPPPAPKIF